MAGVSTLSWLVFLPLAGAMLLLCIPAHKEVLIKRFSLAVSLLPLLLTVMLFQQFSKATAGYQWVEKVPWFPMLGMQYVLGMDGLSLLLVGLTAVLTPLAIYASFGSIRDQVKAFFSLLLVLETGMLGVFLALDLMLFFLFWEATLLPMYFLIGMWGGTRRVYASFKFLLYMMAGSLFLLFSILVVYFLYFRATGVQTFLLPTLLSYKITGFWEPLLFLGFSIAFLVKVPMFPFHTWLPDAHVEAPTAGSVILAGILLKMGTYGFLRFSLPLFPQAFGTFTPLLATLALIGIVYGALVALAQRDMKSLVAYSSVSHLGFVMLGILSLTPEGLSGSVLQMVNHGLSTGALFLLVGMLYDRRHTRDIAEFGGIAQVMPRYWLFFLFISLSSIGLPGLNGFVGEFLILLGAFGRVPLWGMIAGLGVILSAIYLLWLTQRIFHGPVTLPENKALRDLHFSEMLTLVPIVFLILWIGIYPNFFLSRFSATSVKFLSVSHQEVKK